MELELDQSQKEIRKAVREFARGELDKELSQELDRTGTFPVRIREKAAELGFIGIHFPEEAGGGGMGVMENAIVAEELCRKDSTIGSALMLSCFASEYLLRFGDERQRKRLLPEVAGGRILSGGAWVGAESASGNAGVLPAAMQTEEGYRVSGEIESVVNAGIAGLYFVPCSHGKEGNGLSILLIEASCHGLGFEKKHDRLGLRMTPTAKMVLRDVSVSRENLIGKENRGEEHCARVSGELRVLLSALALGAAQGAFDRSLAYVRQREQFGKKIAQFQVTRHKLAEMVTQIEQARYLTYAAAASFDSRNPDDRLSAMAKLCATRTAVAVAGEAIQLLGGYGYMAEYEVERFYRDAKTLQLMGGNSVTLKDVIGKSLIGRIR